MATCACCGQERGSLAALDRRPDVALCEGCVAGLRSQFPAAVEATPMRRSGSEGAGGGTCYLTVADVEPWHADWIAAGYEPGPVEDLPWGMREFRIADPDGNTIRVGQPA